MRTVASGLVVLVLGGSTAGGQSPPTFRGGTDLVAVGVSVREQGRPVTALQASDFEVRDNQVLQDVIDVSYEKLPIDVTVALDVSESVTGAVLDAMRRAVGQLQADLAAVDRLKVLTFNMRVRRLLDFSEPRDRADAALRRVRARGSTSLVDALAVALMAPAHPDRRHLVIVFSDGVDTSSVTDRPTMLDLARHSEATASFVLPANAVMSGIGGVAFYDQLAAQTGGMVMPMQPKDDLGPTFSRVLAEFRSSYVVHYAPKGVDSGGLHVLDVRVKRRAVDVRARREYAWR